MKVEKNEMLFIYDSSDIQQREGLAYAKSLKHHEIKELDVQSDSITQLQLSKISKKLGVSSRELIRTDNESHFSDLMDLDEHDMLDYLASNLKMLRTPIVVYSDHAKFIGSQYELIKEDGLSNKTNVQTSRTIRQREGG